jgi:predicted metal-dependent hydrolase
MEPQVMRIGDLDVHVTVSDRRRTVRLTVERDATVTALIPPATDEAKLARAITAKRPWLYAKLRERAETGTPRPPREFVSGEGFPYLGRSYRLLLTDDAAHSAVRLHRGRLELRRDCVSNARHHLVHWYRQVGEPWLRQRVAPWAQRMEVEVTHLRALPLGYRWGSCTADGKLNIHWATMQLPPVLVDYVLVHELAHVRHPDHGLDFWRAVERPLPDLAARRTRLRLTGPALWLPDGDALPSRDPAVPGGPPPR